MPEMGAEPVDVKDFEESTVTDNIDDILEDTGTTIPGTITTLQTSATNILRMARARGVNVWYVNAAISSSGAGTTWATAFKTIQEGHDAATAGDVVVIMPGTYDEDAAAGGLTISTAGLTIIGLHERSRQPILINNTHGSATDCVTITGNNTYMRGLTAYQSALIGFNIDADFSMFYDLMASNCAVGLILSGDNCTFEDCVFASYTLHAIRLSACIGCFFKNCITGVGSTGSDIAVKAYTGATWNVFMNCKIMTGTKSYEIDSGAVYTSFINCAITGFSSAGTDAGTGSNFVNPLTESKISAGDSLQDDLATLWADTKTINTTTMGTPVANSLGDYQITHDKHFHTRERWLGISGDQSGNDWALDTLTHFTAISGNNAYGADANDEAKVLGSDDTPILTGKEIFDIHRILVLASSVATVYKLRIVYGTGTMANAVTAGQFSEIMFIRESAAGRGNMIEVKMPKLAVDTQVWVQAWSATDNATIDFLVGVHEYDTPEVP